MTRVRLGWWWPLVAAGVAFAWAALSDALGVDHDPDLFVRGLVAGTVATLAATERYRLR